jgi:hypothetical protein
VAQQLQAVGGAIEKPEKALMDDHISHCVNRSLKAAGRREVPHCASSGSSLAICENSDQEVQNEDPALRVGWL